MRKVHWVAVTSDKKVGPVPVSYSGPDSCPGSCSLKEGGCYWWSLFYARKLGADIDSGKRHRTIEEALPKALRYAKIVRHRVGGDIVGDEVGTLHDCQVADAAGLGNILFTHAWRTPEAQLLKGYARASCQSWHEVLEAVALGWSTAIIVDRWGRKGSSKWKGLGPNKELTLVNCAAAKIWDHNGRRAGYTTDCNTCRMCVLTPRTRNLVVAFPLHGNHMAKNAAITKVVTWEELLTQINNEEKDNGNQLSR